MNKVAARLKRRAAAEKNPASATVKALLAGAKEIELLEKRRGPGSLRSWMVGMDTLIETLHRKVGWLETYRVHHASELEALKRRSNEVAKVLNKLAKSE